MPEEDVALISRKDKTALLLTELLVFVSALNTHSITLGSTRCSSSPVGSV
jgi:hypothetical protein